MRDAAGDRELRQAVVIAGRAWTRALLTEALLALKQRRRLRLQLQVELQVVGFGNGNVTIALSAQLPIIDVNIERSLRRLGEAKAGRADFS